MHEIGDEVHVLDRDWTADGSPWRVIAGKVVYAWAGPRGVCRIDARRYRGAGHRGYMTAEGWRVFGDGDLDAAFDQAVALNEAAMTRTPEVWIRARLEVISG